MQVNTVLGPRDVETLGICLPHEHLHCESFRHTGNMADILTDQDLVVSDLESFQALGGQTVIEVTPPDLGRNPHALVEIAKRTGLNVLMSCGRYREPTYEKDLWRRSADDIAEEFVTEIRDGVDGVRPALIGEIGVDRDFVSPIEERVHRAAARAHSETGLPITLHAIRWPTGLDQVKILTEEGVSPDRVVVGHCDSYPSKEYHLAVAATGAYVEFDLFRGVFEIDTERGVAMVLAMLHEGYEDQILLSQDICFERYLRVKGGGGYSFVLAEVLGRLRSGGVSQATLDRLMVENPHRLLAGG